MIKQEGYVYTLMDKSQTSNNNQISQRNENMNSKQNNSKLWNFKLKIYLKLDNNQSKQLNEKKNYVIEFNKDDLRPHLILEKDINQNKKNNNENQNNYLDNSNIKKNINQNYYNNQEIVSESNNFYYNEGK